MSVAVRIGLAAMAVCGLLHAQTFDAASIKPAAAATRGYSIQPLAGKLSARNANLKQLIAAAYHVQDYQIAGGPKWMDSDAYDVEAKAVDSDIPPAEKELMTMLRKLLEQRFSLAIRRETKDLPVYVLQPAKTGAKVRQTKDTSSAVIFKVYQRHQRHQVTSQNAPLSYLVEGLSWILGRPIVDRTGLAAVYDYTLEWAPDDLQLRSDETPVTSDGSLPSLGAALQEQIGLRLTQQHGPVEIINVERAEKPTVN